MDKNGWFEQHQRKGHVIIVKYHSCEQIKKSNFYIKYFVVLAITLSVKNAANPGSTGQQQRGARGGLCEITASSVNRFKMYYVKNIIIKYVVCWQLHPTKRMQFALSYCRANTN